MRKIKSRLSRARAGVAATAVLAAMLLFFFPADHEEVARSSVEVGLAPSLSPGDGSAMRGAATAASSSTSSVPRGMSDLSLSLGLQLPGLRSDADSGDQHAICVLSAILDLCGREADRAALYNYPDGYLLSMSEEQLESFTRFSRLYEGRVSSVCVNLDHAELADADDRLMRAALAGNVRAMSKFALLPFRMDDGAEAPKGDFERAYKENAESMLNRAAEAGDLDAISAIAFSYSSGFIESAMGNLPVQTDPVKALAAFRVLMRIRDNPGNDPVPPKYTNEGGLLISEDALRDMARTMSPAEISRAERIASTYHDAYRNVRAQHVGVHDMLKDLPEHACEGFRGKP